MYKFLNQHISFCPKRLTERGLRTLQVLKNNRADDNARPTPPPENRRGRETNRRHASPAMKGRVPGEERGRRSWPATLAEKWPLRGGGGGGCCLPSCGANESRLIAIRCVGAAAAANELPTFYNCCSSQRWSCVASHGHRSVKERPGL